MTPPRVLVCGMDAVLEDLLTRNLVRREFEVVQRAWAPCCGGPEELPGSIDAMVVDLDCPEPDCWHGVEHLRTLAPTLPAVLLADAWADAGRVKNGRHYVYLHKPVALDDVLGALRRLLAAPE